MALFSWTNRQQAAVYTRKANRVKLEAEEVRLLETQTSNKVHVTKAAVEDTRDYRAGGYLPV
jgi:hypothetical protein